jgi:isochorismate pyruvate lyase
MADVRREVDRIDRALVGLIAERQALMEAAAGIKPARAAIRDPARIEDVVAKVLDAAKAAGLSPRIAEPMWRTLIERCIAHEFEIWDARERD